MAQLELITQLLDLSEYRFGTVQHSGAMTVIALFGPHGNGRYSPPLTGLKLTQVKGYGSIELENPLGRGVAIVPLHIGYIQDRAQNHCLCSAALIGAGQKRTFDDACCVQESQGGYLEGKDQWFFVLPLALRKAALSMRGVKDYGKLWDDISQLNRKFGLSRRGHLEQIISRKKAYLTQFQSRFERLPNQTGAVFFINNRLAGLEIAPSAEYFEELWAPLVCFCYGVSAMYVETAAGWSQKEPEPFSAGNLEDLRKELEDSRRKVTETVYGALDMTSSETFSLQEEERFLDMRLHTVTGNQFAGQVVEEQGRLVYASIAAGAENSFGGY